MRTRGYSLVELMVGIAIAGVVMAAAVPNLRSYRESQRLQGATEVVAASVAEAKARARSMNMSVIVEYRVDEAVIAVIDDADGDGVEDDTEHVEVHPLDTGLVLASTTFTDDRLVFDSRGTAVSGGSIFVTGADGLPPKRVRISAGTGHVAVRGVESVGDEN